jgi:hypothetical protein
LIVTCDPPICETKIPPIIAVKIPDRTGKPEAREIATQSGRAIKETRSPEVRFLDVILFEKAG